MSFILDALKKAEAERQRQTGPTLLEVRVTQPRRRFPLWTIVIGALLGINIVLLFVFVLRKPGGSNATDRPPAAIATPPAAAVAPAPAAAVPPASSAPATAPAISAPATSAPALAAPAPNMPSTPATPRAPPSSNALDLSPADAAGAIDDADTQNPADLEPALPANGATGGGKRPPNLTDIGGDMPDLRLDLHVYAVRPADRYALINMHRVHEGDVLPEGPRVLAIDRDGVELSYHGTEFMIRPQ